MSRASIEALNIEVARAKELFESLSPEEWAAPSGCTDWRVQDVVQHMAAVFQQIAAPDTIDTGGAATTEAGNEVPVQDRKDWTPEQVAAAYDEWSERGVAALAALQDPPMADTVVPINDLGAHPLHLLGNAIVFDHYCHLRHDIGAAVERAAELPQDDGALQLSLTELWLGGEQLTAEHRQRLRRSFGCPVRNSYGASEFLSITFECAHGMLHLNSDWVVLEAVA